MFWTFGAFYVLLGLDQIIKLEGNICLLNYNAFYCLLPIITRRFTSQMCLDHSD